MLYNVHVGMRFTTDIVVEADDINSAINKASYKLDELDMSELEYASEDYDAWEIDNQIDLDYAKKVLYGGK